MKEKDPILHTILFSKLDITEKEMESVFNFLNESNIRYSTRSSEATWSVSIKGNQDLIIIKLKYIDLISRILTKNPEEDKYRFTYINVNVGL